MTVKPKAFNITAKRLEALRFIQKHPGCYVGAVANEVLTSEYRRAHKTGFWSQQATRSGAGYCQKLRDAGLVTINTFTEYGYGTVTITPAGEQALLKWDSLAAAVARSLAVPQNDPEAEWFDQSEARRGT